jgi:hypothetical protein
MSISFDPNIIRCQRHPIPQHRHLYDDLCQSHHISRFLSLNIVREGLRGEMHISQADYI